MRNLMVISVALWAPTLVAAQAQKSPSVAELQAEAIQNNLDVRVAEAELHLAEAKYARAHGNLQARVALAIAEVESARREVEHAFPKVELARKLFTLKAIGPEGVTEVEDSLRRRQQEVDVRAVRLAQILSRAKDAPFDNPLDLAKLQAEALSRSRDVAAAEAELRIASDRLKLIRSRIMAEVESSTSGASGPPSAARTWGWASAATIDRIRGGSHRGCGSLAVYLIGTRATPSYYSGSAPF